MNERESESISDLEWGEMTVILYSFGLLCRTNRVIWNVEALIMA